MIGLFIAGLGNIGAALVEFLGRTAGIGSVVLADPDVFTGPNLVSQFVPAPASAIGRPKVEAIARRLSELNPLPRVTQYACGLEHVPRGQFRGRIVITGCDTRLARARMNEIAAATGVKLWLDLGVRGADALARCTISWPSIPGAAAVCCGWSDRDWELLAADISCASGSAAPSRSTAYLGAAAAALGVRALEDYMASDLAPDVNAHSRLLCLRPHRAWTSVIRPNPRCRLLHAAWDIAPLGRGAAECHLRELSGEGTLAVPGMPWARRLRCLGCGEERECLRVAARLRTRDLTCPGCGGRMTCGPLDQTDEFDLSAHEVAGSEASALALADLGVLEGDIVRLSGARHLEVGASARQGG